MNYCGSKMGATRLGSLTAHLHVIGKLSALIVTVSIANFFISRAVFNPATLSVLHEVDHYVHVAAPSLLGDATETGKLGKMNKLWPAYRHPFLYFVYSLSCVLSIKASEIATKEKASSLQDVIRKSVMMGVALFAWIALPLRIAEMHYAVIAMDFVHAVLTYSLTALTYRALYHASDAAAQEVPITNKSD